MLGQVSGFKMIESIHAKEEDGKMGVYVKRSLKERLFSTPWRPIKKTRLMIVTRYKPAMYRIYDRIIYHPSLKDEIMKLAKV